MKAQRPAKHHVKHFHKIQWNKPQCCCISTNCIMQKFKLIYTFLLRSSTVKIKKKCFHCSTMEKHEETIQDISCFLCIPIFSQSITNLLTYHLCSFAARKVFFQIITSSIVPFSSFLKINYVQVSVVRWHESPSCIVSNYDILKSTMTSTANLLLTVHCRI